MTSLIVFLAVGLASTVFNVLVIHPLLIRVRRCNMFKDDMISGIYGEPTGSGYILGGCVVVPPLVSVVFMVVMVIMSQSFLGGLVTGILEGLEHVGQSDE